MGSPDCKTEWRANSWSYYKQPSIMKPFTNSNLGNSTVCTRIMYTRDQSDCCTLVIFCCIGQTVIFVGRWSTALGGPFPELLFYRSGGLKLLP